MNPEVAKLALRAIVDYLDGDKVEFLRLTRLAMQHSGEMTCQNCGGIQIPCRVGRKGKMKQGYICTDCGQIIVEGQEYRKCNVPRKKAASWLN